MLRTITFIISCVVFLTNCSHLKSIHKSQTPEPTPEVSSSPPSGPGGRGTPDEARAMMMRAVEHYKAVGRTKALADFTAMKSPFGDRDLYVVCIGSNHRISANGGFAQFVGASADVLKDAEGRSLGKAIWSAAWETGEGTVDYTWVNPVSHITERKIGYFKRVGEDICGVGAYRVD